MAPGALPRPLLRPRQVSRVGPEYRRDHSISCSEKLASRVVGSRSKPGRIGSQAPSRREQPRGSESPGPTRRRLFPKWRHSTTTSLRRPSRSARCRLRRARSIRPSPVPRGSSRRNPSGLFSRMPAWARLAPWSTRGPTAPPYGPARRSRISRVTGLPARSGCRRTRCTVSGSPAPASMAATTPATPGSTRQCCRRRWAGRCASRACATKGMAGTPRGRPRSTMPAPHSTRTVG